jgi:hypothetical protein
LQEPFQFLSCAGDTGAREHEAKLAVENLSQNTTSEETTMEPAQIRQKLTQLDQVIDRAAQAVRDDQRAPQELKSCVQELGTQAKEAQQSLSDGDAQATLIECVDEMEETSDRAKKACEAAKGLSQQAKSAVLQAHQQLSDLKHQLH